MDSNRTTDVVADMLANAHARQAEYLRVPYGADNNLLWNAINTIEAYLAKHASGYICLESLPPKYNGIKWIPQPRLEAACDEIRQVRDNSGDAMIWTSSSELPDELVKVGVIAINIFLEKFAVDYEFNDGDVPTWNLIDWKSKQDAASDVSRTLKDAHARLSREYTLRYDKSELDEAALTSLIDIVEAYLRDHTESYDARFQNGMMTWQKIEWIGDDELHSQHLIQVLKDMPRLMETKKKKYKLPFTDAEVGPDDVKKANAYVSGFLDDHTDHVTVVMRNGLSWDNITWSTGYRQRAEREFEQRRKDRSDTFELSNNAEDYMILTTAAFVGGWLEKHATKWTEPTTFDGLSGPIVWSGIQWKN